MSRSADPGSVAPTPHVPEGPRRHKEDRQDASPRGVVCCGGVDWIGPVRQNKRMRFLGRRLWVAQVWLAAVMLPVASLPHFCCICPDGHVKPFCLGLASKESGCCCGGSCCGSAPRGGDCCNPSPTTKPRAEPRCCCCQSHPEQATQPTADAGHQLGGLACQKTLIRTDLVAVPDEQAHPRVSAGPITWLSVTPTALLLPPPRWEPAHLCWQTYELPPPTDLVIALQRFII